MVGSELLQPLNLVTQPDLDAIRHNRQGEHRPKNG